MMTKEKRVRRERRKAELEAMTDQEKRAVFDAHFGPGEKRVAPVHAERMVETILEREFPGR